MQYNPFAFLVETWQFRYARAWRTSITQKMIDTFFIFAGRFKSEIELQSHGSKSILFDIEHLDNHLNSLTLGLFDYALLGLPVLLTWAATRFVLKMRELSDTETHNPSNSLLYRGLILLLNYLADGLFLFSNVIINVLSRLIFGLLGVFFVGLLITLPIAYLAMRISRSTRQEAFDLKGTTTCGSDLPGMQTYKAKEDSLSLRDFIIINKTMLRGDVWSNDEEYRLDVVSSASHYYLKIQYADKRYQYYSEITQANLSHINALLQINFAHAVDVLLNASREQVEIAEHLKSVFSGQRFFKAINACSVENTHVVSHLTKIPSANHL